MKKLLLFAALGLFGFAAQAAEALTDASFAGFTYDADTNLWKSANVSLASTYFADSGWGEITAPSVDVSNQSISLTTPAGMGYSQWQGQVKVLANVALSASETYDFSCIVEGPADAKVTVKLATSNDAAAEVAELGFWNQASLTSAGKTCYYISGFSTAACDYVALILDFGGYPDKAFTVSNIVIQQHQENADLPAEPTYEVPASVPVPTQDEADVLSLFSSKYTAATTFAIAYDWGSPTSIETISIDNQSIYFLKNFTWEGWTLNPSVDVSDYTYLHLDYWTPDGTALNIYPIGKSESGATQDTQYYAALNLSNTDWNQIDVPLSQFADNINLKDIFQFKLDGAGGVYGYIANIYFYKSDDNGQGGTPETPEGNGKTYYGTITDTYTGTPSYNGEDQTDLEFTLTWNATWNENATVTFNIKIEPEVVGLVPQLFDTTGHLGNFDNGTFNTTATYEEGTTPFKFYLAYAGGGPMTIDCSYVVGSSNDETENPGDDNGDDDNGDNDDNGAMTFVANGVTYTVDWTATWNVDETITFNITITPEGLDGISPQMFVDNAYEGNFEGNETDGWTYTTTGTYQEGETPNLALYVAYAGGASSQMPFNYTVVSDSGTDSIEEIGSVDANAPIEYYNLQGVRVQNPSHGIYIIRQGDKTRKAVIR